MDIRFWAGAVVVAVAGTAFAQRPLVYPLRSQSAGAQSVDNAYCYWQAREQTGVDIVREPQRPLRTKPPRFAPDAGRGTSQPPLPLPASTTKGEAESDGAGEAVGPGATPPATSSASAPAESSAASTVLDGSGASESAAAGAHPVHLPPPPSDPPMTRYWRAYGECMKSRGYGVEMR